MPRRRAACPAPGPISARPASRFQRFRQRRDTASSSSIPLNSPLWARAVAGESHALRSDPEILLELAEVRREIRVGDRVDDAAVLDDAVAIGEGRGEVKILLDEQ